MKSSDIVVVNENIPTAGAVIWWRLSGNVDAGALKTAWLASDLPEGDLPDPPSEVTALRRAMADQREARRLVRPLGRGNGFAIVDERVKDDKTELAYEVILTAKLDQVGRLTFETPSGVDDGVRGIIEEIRAAFDRHLETLSQADISDWLAKMVMRQLDAVSLRDTGGVYFLPRPSVERIGTVADVLRQSSAHVVHRVPALRSEEAVDAILDAVSHEAANEAIAMEGELAEEALGKRGLENRITHCDNVERKVARYEELLGRSLDTLRDRLENIRAKLSVALVKADAADGQPSLANV